METLIILATVMALFGVLGYVRGARSSLLTSAIILLGLIAVGRAPETIARTINGLNVAVRFALSGGLGALGGGGDRAAALQEVFAKLGEVKPLIGSDGTGPGMILIFLALVLAGFLLGMLKPLKGRPSLLGLGLGLTIGYVLSAFLVRTFLPEASVGLRLPAWLFGRAAQPVPAPPADGTELTAALGTRLAATLNSLVESGQIALFLAIAIAAFVLLATRLGARTIKKG